MDFSTALQTSLTGSSRDVGTAGFAPVVKAGAFTTSDVPSGTWMVGHDTSNSTIKLYYNDAGSLKAVALA